MNEPHTTVTRAQYEKVWRALRIMDKKAKCIGVLSPMAYTVAVENNEIPVMAYDRIARSFLMRDLEPNPNSVQAYQQGVDPQFIRLIIQYNKNNHKRN